MDLSLTTATAPWFYVSLLSGLLGVVGIVTGAVVSYKSIKASDLRKLEFESKRIVDQYSREDQQRSEDQIRALCATYIQTLSDLYYLVSPYNQGTTKPTPDKVRQAKSKAYQASTITQLVVDQSVVDAGKDFYVSTCDYVDHTLEHGLQDPKSKELAEGYKENRNKYLNAARSFLGRPALRRT